MQNAGYLFAAFAIAWAVILGYILVLFGQERRLRKDIRSLQEALREKKAGR